MIRAMNQPDIYANIGAMGVPDAMELPNVRAPRRGAVYGSRFATATDHPLASLAAMDVMQRGGNAADAAIAAAFVNVVTKPHRTHLGGDAFCLVWRRGANTVDCLNAGGLAPLNATLDRFPNGIPYTGPTASAVPGFVDAILALHVTYGTRPLYELLAPAIRYAEEGFPGLDASRRRPDDAPRLHGGRRGGTTTRPAQRRQDALRSRARPCASPTSLPRCGASMRTSRRTCATASTRTRPPA